MKTKKKCDKRHKVANDDWLQTFNDNLKAIKSRAVYNQFLKSHISVEKTFNFYNKKMY